MLNVNWMPMINVDPRLTWLSNRKNSSQFATPHLANDEVANFGKAP